jgi:hypothetical protein
MSEDVMEVLLAEFEEAASEREYAALRMTDDAFAKRDDRYQSARRALLAHVDALRGRVEVADEMVERAAVGMYDHDEGRVRNWNACHEETRYHYRSLARRALTAALGGDREGVRG